MFLSLSLPGVLLDFLLLPSSETPPLWCLLPPRVTTASVFCRQTGRRHSRSQSGFFWPAFLPAGGPSSLRSAQTSSGRRLPRLWPHADDSGALLVTLAFLLLSRKIKERKIEKRNGEDDFSSLSNPTSTAVVRRGRATSETSLSERSWSPCEPHRSSNSSVDAADCIPRLISAANSGLTSNISGGDAEVRRRERWRSQRTLQPVGACICFRFEPIYGGRLSLTSLLSGTRRHEGQRMK